VPSRFALPRQPGTDAYEAFLEASGPYDKAVAKRLHDDVFSVGNTVDRRKAIAPSAATTPASAR